MEKKGWDAVYRQGGQLSIWPWSDLVALYSRHAKRGGGLKVLELGCGAGANIPFVISRLDEYYAIESSEYAVTQLQKKYPNLEANIKKGNFSENLGFENKFDLIIDRASVTHNNRKKIEKIIDLVYQGLNSGGIYIGCDWFSTEHTDFVKGEIGSDQNTREFVDGQFKDVGEVHFVDEEGINKIFKHFQVLEIYKKRREVISPKIDKILSTFDIVARKQ